MKTALRLAAGLLGLWGMAAPVAGRLVHFPTYAQHKDWEWMEVYRAELTSGEAVFDVTFYGRPGDSLRLSAADVLRGLPSGRTCRLLRAVGVDLGRPVVVPDSGSRTLRIAFEPVAVGDTAVDWLSGTDGHKVYEALSLCGPAPDAAGIVCHVAGRAPEGVRVSRYLLLPDGADPRVTTPLSLPVVGGRFGRDLRFARNERFSLIAYEELLEGSFRSARFYAENARVDVTFRRDAPPVVASDGVLNVQALALGDEVRTRFESRCEPIYERMERLFVDRRAYTPEANALFDSLKTVSARYYSRGGTQRDGDRLDSLYALRDRMESDSTLYAEAYYALADSLRLIGLESYAWQRRWAGLHPTIVGLYVVRDQLESDLLPQAVYDELAALFERRFAGPFATHPAARICRAQIDGRSSLRPGGRYMDYTATRLDGGDERLGPLMQGRVTLVDLWASWCGPCRRNSVRLIPVYEKWSPYGFQVIGIAREHGNTRAMRQAIARDGYPWPQFVDLDDRHGVWERHRLARSGGGTMLVDSDGTVMAVNPAPDEVDRLLAKRFGTEK